MGLFKRWRVAKLRQVADKHTHAAINLLQTGRAAMATDHILRAFEAVAQLRRLEPGEVEHVVQLAGIYYNNAAICEQCGNVSAALNNAMQAHAHYLEACGGDISPDNVPLVALFEVAGSLRPPQGPQLRELVPLVADAKARYARLLARHRGPEAADEVHALGHNAVGIYQQLSRRDPTFARDLRRIQTQYEQAKGYLER